jgi:hypothetical protein
MKALLENKKKELRTEETKKAFKVLNINNVLCMNWKEASWSIRLYTDCTRKYTHNVGIKIKYLERDFLPNSQYHLTSFNFPIHWLSGRYLIIEHPYHLLSVNQYIQLSMNLDFLVISYFVSTNPVT